MVGIHIRFHLEKKKKLYLKIIISWGTPGFQHLEDGAPWSVCEADRTGPGRARRYI